MFSRNALSAFLVTVLLSLSLASPATAQDDDGDVVVRVGLHAAEKNLNPFIVPQALPLTHDFTMLVYDSLFWSQSRLDPEPWLATDAQPSADYRTWTVTLRDDVVWHDGVPFSAADVAFTFKYFADVAGPGRYGHHVYDHPVFESATVVGDDTVEIAFADARGRRWTAAAGASGPSRWTLWRDDRERASWTRDVQGAARLVESEGGLELRWRQQRPATGLAGPLPAQEIPSGSVPGRCGPDP